MCEFAFRPATVKRDGIFGGEPEMVDAAFTRRTQSVYNVLRLALNYMMAANTRTLTTKSLMQYRATYQNEMLTYLPQCTANGEQTPTQRIQTTTDAFDYVETTSETASITTTTTTTRPKSTRRTRPNWD